MKSKKEEKRESKDKKQEPDESLSSKFDDKETVEAISRYIG